MVKVVVNKPKPQPPITFTIEDVSIEEMVTLVAILGVSSTSETPAATDLYAVVNAALNLNTDVTYEDRELVRKRHTNYLRGSYGKGI